MIELRPYQIKAIQDLREAYRTNNRILLVMPTGAGKTVVFSQICASAIERGKKVLILSDRVEIFSQTVKTLSHHEIPVCKIDAQNKSIYYEAQLFVGMVETFKRRLDQFSGIKFDLIIFDEAHKAAFNKVMDAYPDTKTLGCTATPVGKTLHKYYSKLIQSIDIPELIEQGFLSPCRGYQMQDDFSDLQTDKTGEFSDQSLFNHFNKSKLYEGVVDAYLEKAANKKTLVFCCNIQHAANTCQSFIDKGILAKFITSDASKEERDFILKEYDRGTFKVLVNANILVAGYDNPSIEVIIMNRATTAINLWLQAAGRGSRIYPNKTEFLLIDFGGNFDRHGLWHEARNWTLEPPKKKKKGLGASPVKSCKACSAMLPATIRECPYCGYKFELTEKELAQGKLVEVTNNLRSGIIGRSVSELSVIELIECEKAKTLKSSYVWRILRARKEEDLFEYARLKNYRDHWIFRQIETKEAEQANGEAVKFYDKKIKEINFL